MHLLGISALFLVLLGVISETPNNPYAVLGLSKRAKITDIKRAYKSLVKEWHPDKNDSPDANEKFMAISDAYKLLSDPLKKERYDKYGTFDDEPQRHGHHHGFGGFDNFFGGGFGGFDDEIFAKQRISLRQYTHSILERSHQQPFILYAYSNYCQLCFHLKNQWKAASDDLGPRGYGIGTVNAMTDGNLLEKLRVSHLPAIVAIVEGRAIPFRTDMRTLTDKKIRIFARDVIPRTFLLPINSHDKLKRFIDRWKATNKVSVLILGAAPEPRIRYLLAAMKFSHFARFAYVHIGGTAEINAMREDLSIKCTKCENILIFNDFPQSGAVGRLSISNINQLDEETLNNLIETNKFLTLPRLASSQYLDELCPVSSRNPRHLCVILPVVDSVEDEQFVETWRQYALKSALKWKQMKVRLVYVYANKQSDWLRPFLEKRTGETEPTARDVLVMWRVEHVKARFYWLNSIWNGTEVAIEKKLTDILTQRIRLQELAAVGNMVDENAPSWWTRLCRTVVRMWEAAWYHLTKEEAYPVVAAIVTFLVILSIGYFLNYMSQDARPKKVSPGSFSTEENWHPDDPKVKPDSKTGSAQAKTRMHRVMSVMSPLMHELRAESYFGMIRLLKPGCRSLVLLIDEDSKDILLPQFAEAVYPLRNNKTFSFGYLMVEKNLPWFRKLLEHTLPSDTQANGEEAEGGSGLYQKLKSINPRQTVGTVLTLCGWKLYFSIYHPMHTAGKRKHFLGFDDDDEDMTDSDSDGENGTKEEQTKLRGNSRLNTDNVLNGFPNWLDRLLEGSIRRYYIPEWPDNLR